MRPTGSTASSNEPKSMPLFPEVAELDIKAKRDACQRGWHGKTRSGEPVDLGECVNVDEVCTDCHVTVRVTSWSKAAWLARQTA